MTISRGSPVPLYHQLKQAVLERIEKGEWSAGDLIPPESALQEEYRLSRTTVREAIGQLVTDGVLCRQRGKGTFVAYPKVRHGPQRSYGLTGYLYAHGLKPGWRVLSIKVLPASLGAVQALGLEPGERVYRIERLRLADNEAIGYHAASVPLRLGIEISEGDLLAGESSLAYLTEVHHVGISESHRILEAISATEEDGRLLGVRKGSPLLSIRRTTISDEGKPIEYLVALYRGDRFEYYVHFEH